MRLVLLAAFSLPAMAQLAPLAIPAYDSFRYATAGRPFSYTFQPAGGAPPYTFALDENAVLPPGLRLNASTGELAGAILQPGEHRTSFCVSDLSRAKICLPFLVIAVATEGELYTELIPARVNSEYQNLIARPGEFTEVAYDPASGNFPPGMILEITGRLYGTPRAPGGAFAFRVRGKDFDGNTVVRPFLIRVLGPLVATSVLPNGFNATEYSTQLSVIGDMPPHTWTVRRGPLPPGFILSDNGRISGVCNFSGTFPFTLRATDAAGTAADRDMVITIEPTLPPLTVTTTGLPGGAIGVPYRQQINVSGGRSPYSYRVLGPLPPGLTLSSSALLSGTPTTAGSYLFTVEVRDISGAATSKAYTVAVSNLRYTGPASIPAFAQEETRIALTAEGGTPPFRWTIVAGSLPTGMALSEAGVLSGTAVAQSSATATVRLTDSTGLTVEFPITVAVAAPRPAISANGIVNGASFATGAIAPGQIVTLFGQRMGPATLAPFLLDGAGRIPTALAGTRVLIGGQPAPLLYVSATQIGAIVPYNTASRTTVDVVVDANGVRSASVDLPFAASAPGLFTADSSGRGQAAALNQDGSLNGAASPATTDSIVVLFGTGEGQTLPAGQDGAITGANPPRPALPVSVTIGGRDAQVLYAGAAPGLVAGVLQLNVRIPAGVTPGNAVPIQVRIGEATSAPVTLAIR